MRREVMANLQRRGALHVQERMRGRLREGNARRRDEERQVYSGG